MRKLGEMILRELNHAGHQAYFAGGCVRDEVLGLIPKDYDITTSALPDQVEALFKRTVPTGKDYGTITVLVEDSPFEVTTFRLDSDYDGRRPKVVRFGTSLEEDLARRDFTMNAMAMGLDGVVIDPFGGRHDLKNKKIRFVGCAEERIREDRLRVLRYIRFMTTYGLKGDLDCLMGVSLRGLSFERIRDELNKILIAKECATGIQMLADCGLLEQFAPELMAMVGVEQCSPHHHEDVFHHTLTVLSKTSGKLELRLAALLHDVGKPQTFVLDDQGIGHFYGHQKVSAELSRVLMTRLRYSNKEIETVTNLVLHHMRLYEHITEITAKRLIQAVGSDLLALLFELQLADTRSCKGDRRCHIEAIQDMAMMCQSVLDRKMPLKVTDLSLNGHDLMTLGFVGRDIGSLLNLLLEEVIEARVENTPECLRKWVTSSDAYMALTHRVK